ncbi:MAG: hypothetical protein Kow0062_07090 [Acidobacteriota bacterium]
MPAPADRECDLPGEEARGADAKAERHVAETAEAEPAVPPAGRGSLPGQRFDPGSGDRRSCPARDHDSGHQDRRSTHEKEIPGARFGDESERGEQVGETLAWRRAIRLLEHTQGIGHEVGTPDERQPGLAELLERIDQPQPGKTRAIAPRPGGRRSEQKESGENSRDAPALSSPHAHTSAVLRRRRADRPGGV